MGNGPSQKDPRGRDFLLESVGDHESGVTCMAISEDGALLVTGSDDNTARMWSTGTEEIECIGVLNGHTSYVTCLVIGDLFIFTGSADCTIRKWNMKTCACVFVYEGHTSRICRLLLVNKLLFSSSADATAKAWMCNTVSVRDGREKSACVKTFQGHTHGVYSIIFVPGDDDILFQYNMESSRDIIITGSADGTAKSWDLDTCIDLQTFYGHTGPITCMSTDVSGSTLFTGSLDATIRVWDIQTGFGLRVMEGHESAVLCLLVVNKLMYSGSADGTARCWVTDFGDCTRIYRGHNHSVVGLAFFGGVLFTISNDTCARAFDAKSGVLERLYKGHTAAVTSMAPVEGKLYTGSTDSTVRVWDAANIVKSSSVERSPKPDEEFQEKQQKHLKELEKRLEEYGESEPV